MKVHLLWHDLENDVTWGRDVDLPIPPFPGLEVGLAVAGSMDVTVESVYVTDRGHVEATIDRRPVSIGEDLTRYGWTHE